jgi:signal transduction histidine kinase/CheY-like chemotaxis protein
MNEHREFPLKSELYLSPRAVTAVLVLSFVMLLSADIPALSALMWVGPCLYVTCGAIWLVDRWSPIASRWLTVALLTGLVLTVNALAPAPGLLTLLAVPAALAAPLLSFSAAIVTATGLSLLLVALSQTPVVTHSGPLAVPLLLIWIILAVTYAIHAPVHDEAQRMWHYYERAQSLVREAQDRQMQLSQAVENLAFANRQLALLNEKVSGLRLIAERAERAKATFLAKVSHEFRTPLNMIIGLTSLLTETPHIYGERLPVKLMEHLEIVHRNCVHLSNMIDDVLDLSQIEAGRMALHRERVDLGKVIQWASAVVQPLVEKKQLWLELDVPADLPAVECDRTRISQVIINLLSNAARFTQAGGIRVRACREDGHVVISVADTGPGISPEDAEVIFEPFCQGISSHWRDKGGSGLGLTISRQFAELHGGRMWLESQLGMGSTFFVRLPMTRPEEPAAAPARWITADWTPRHPNLDLPSAHLAQRMVVCDETGELGHLLSRYAEEMTFIETRHIEEVVREVEKCPAWFVLVNASSPQALWPLVDRTAPRVPDTLIVGCALGGPASGSMSESVVGYLIKPITRAKLHAAMEAVGRPLQRVLVVDDGADDRVVLTALLAAIDDKLAMKAVGNGEDALDTLAEWHPDLMLLDLVMPGMDGWQVMRHKAQDDALREIPTIVVSAQDPHPQPLRSPMIAAALGRGLPVGKLLACARQFASLLLEPD